MVSELLCNISHTGKSVSSKLLKLIIKLEETEELDQVSRYSCHGLLMSFRINHEPFIHSS